MRFPGFTDEWKTFSLGEKVIIKSGISPQCLCCDGNLPYYKVEQLNHCEKELGETPYYGQTSANNIIPKGSIIFPKRGAAIMTNKVRVNASECILDTNLMALIPDSTLYNHFLFYYVLNRELGKIADTSTIPQINNVHINPLKIAIPIQFEEQRKIGNFLSLLDERIATQNKIIDNLQSLIKGLAKIHYDSSPTLRSVKIQELGEPYTVMNFSKEQLSDTGVPCILYGELFTQYGPVIEDVISKTNVTSNLTLSRGRDLLFPSSTTVDALSLIAPSALTKPNIILGGDMFGIEVSDEYSPEYLSLYFNYIGRRDVAKYAIGSTIIHLHYKDIAKHSIQIPSISEQKAFVKLAYSVKIKIDVEKSILHNLTEIKAYLVQNLFI